LNIDVVLNNQGLVIDLMVHREVEIFIKAPHRLGAMGVFLCMVQQQR
jgi:hypothetical protein